MKVRPIAVAAALVIAVSCHNWDPPRVALPRACMSVLARKAPGSPFPPIKSSGKIRRISGPAPTPRSFISEETSKSECAAFNFQPATTRPSRTQNRPVCIYSCTPMTPTTTKRPARSKPMGLCGEPIKTRSNRITPGPMRRGFDTSVTPFIVLTRCTIGAILGHRCEHRRSSALLLAAHLPGGKDQVGHQAG